jgi:hypothetical protein
MARADADTNSCDESEDEDDADEDSPSAEFWLASVGCVAAVDLDDGNN